MKRGNDMLHVIRFMFEQIGKIIDLFFKIDMGFMSVGTFFCCIFFGVPTILLVFNFLKSKFGE